jgi:signal transduction histidine kinase
MAEENIKLLLIEDDDVYRELVRQMLGPGYLICEASTGNGGLELARLHQPDCILLDYRLPDIDGLQLLAILAREYFPVVMLTVEESPEVIVQAMQWGAQDYLVKTHLFKVSLHQAIANAIEKVALKCDLKKKQRDLEEKNRQIRDLASALTLAEQRERRRIAQLLHDEVQQMLYGIQLRVHLIAQEAGPELQASIKAHLEQMEQFIKEGIRLSRSLAVELSPPLLKDEGLAEAFEWLADQMREMHNLDIELNVRGDGHSLAEDLWLLVFQLVRELLFNVVKHAGVRQARLEMFEEGDYLVIRVQDEGVGFDVETLKNKPGSGSGFGLYSVRERLDLFGGRLAMESTPGQGTRMTIFVPKAAHVP